MLGRRCATVLLAAGLAVTGTALAGPAAAADGDDCTLTDVTPHAVVIGLSTVTRTFAVEATGCTVTSWSVFDPDSGDGIADSARSDVDFPMDDNSAAGYHDLGAVLVSQGGQKTGWTVPDGLDLKRRTTWKSGSLDASPEPAKKGATITVAGTLLRANWTAGTYQGYAGRKIAVQFKATGGAWTTVAAATSDSKGRVAAKVKAKATGAWRLVYGGNTTAGPATSTSDTVGVRG